MGDFVIVLTSIMAAFGTICAGMIIHLFLVAKNDDTEWCECTKCGDTHPILDFDTDDGARG